jgi:hypothetical protein
VTYRGKYKNGTVVLPKGVNIPEGAEVEVTPIRTRPNGSGDESESSFYERYKEFIGALDGLPSDLAENHDYYLYGALRRKR